MNRFAAAGHHPRPGRIVTVGRLVPKKGFDVLLEACGILHRRGVPFQLRVIGGGDLREDLQTRAAREGIAHQTHFLGARPQPEVIAELAAAEIFALVPVVLPDGDRDGIPNVLLEAMAVGAPVVASAVSGIPEVIVDRSTGRLVPQRRPDVLAAVLSELLADASARRHLAGRARQQVLAQSRWDDAVIPIRDLLRDRLDPGLRADVGEVECETVG